MARHPVHPGLRDVADLLVADYREAGDFCSEVAWHVSDRPVTYSMIAAVLEAHPRTHPTPEVVAGWIMALAADADADEASDLVDLEFDPTKSKLNVIQRHDFRDALAGIKKCPHGVPITYRCRICRPND